MTSNAGAEQIMQPKRLGFASKEDEKADNKLIIDQTKISGGTTQKFKPGASYNVYITIYGFEKIEVTAVLTAWENGGDIDADIEDGK